MMLDDGEPPPTRDPRDYVGTDPLCACSNPSCMPGSTVGAPHDYTPHPDTPASFAEHRAAIVATVKAAKKWPPAGELAMTVREAIGPRFHDMSYAQVLAGLRLTDARWNGLGVSIEKSGAAINRRVGDNLAERGYGSFQWSFRQAFTFFASDAGRERHALGRGPR